MQIIRNQNRPSLPPLLTCLRLFFEAMTTSPTRLLLRIMRLLVALESGSDGEAPSRAHAEMLRLSIHISLSPPLITVAI